MHIAQVQAPAARYPRCGWVWDAVEAGYLTWSWAICRPNNRGRRECFRSMGFGIDQPVIIIPGTSIHEVESWLLVLDWENVGRKNRHSGPSTKHLETKA